MKGASNTSSMKELRRELRREQIEAEILLWDLLRDRKFHNARFRRQHSFGRFIVDFYCPASQLVIELDGAVHDTPEAKLADSEREHALSRLGLSIVRFSNDEILYKSEFVLEEIRENLT